MEHSSAEIAADVGVEKQNTAPRNGGEEDEDNVEVGLDTVNPVLTLKDDLKLIGEYEETIGTVLVLTECGSVATEDGVVLEREPVNRSAVHKRQYVVSAKRPFRDDVQSDSDLWTKSFSFRG